MHLRNRRPIFVPDVYQAEIEKLSKAALMDIAWDYAMQVSGETEMRPRQIMDELRTRMEIIQTHRKQSPMTRAETESDPGMDTRGFAENH